MIFQLMLSAVAASAVGESSCGSMMAEMYHRQLVEHNRTSAFTPKEGDILSALHTPVISAYKGKFGQPITGKIQIGAGASGSPVPDGCPNNCIHPLTQSNNPDAVHYITTILLVNELNVTVAYSELTADNNLGQIASLSYSVAHAKSLTPYAFCSIHGLWKGETITFDEETHTSSTTCQIEKCQFEHTSGATVSTVAALKHRQDTTHGTKDAFPVTDGDILNSLHRPVLVATGSEAVITIGMGSDGPSGCPNGCFHPVTPSSDPAQVHWPEFIYALDQNGNIIALRETSMVVPGVVEHKFVIPKGVTQLTPYTYCNIHGLFVGEPVSVIGKYNNIDGVSCALEF